MLISMATGRWRMPRVDCTSSCRLTAFRRIISIPLLVPTIIGMLVDFSSLKKVGGSRILKIFLYSVVFVI